MSGCFLLKSQNSKNWPGSSSLSIHTPANLQNITESKTWQHAYPYTPANFHNIIEAEEWQHAYQGGALHDGLFSAVWQNHGELGNSTLFTLWRCFRYALFNRPITTEWHKNKSMLTKVVRFMMDSSLPSGRVMVSWGKSISTSAISLPLSPHPT